MLTEDEAHWIAYNNYWTDFPNSRKAPNEPPRLPGPDGHRLA